MDLTKADPETLPHLRCSSLGLHQVCDFDPAIDKYIINKNCQGKF